jgi:hypothetical protein
VVVVRLLRATVLAAAGAVITLAQLNLPSRVFWEKQAGLQWASVAVVASFILFDAIRSVSYAVTAARIREYHENLRAIVAATIAEVVDATGAPWDEVAVHLYRQRGLGPLRRLRLVIAAQAGVDVDSGQRRIRPGKSPVGVAFFEQVVIVEEWAEFVRIASDQGPAAWSHRTERQRYGLNWGQLRRSAAAAPGGVVASPTFDVDGRPDGCIVISGPLKATDLIDDEMRRTLDDVAGSLDRVGPPPRGWWAARER